MAVWSTYFSLAVNAFSMAFSITSSGTVNSTIFVIPVQESTAKALLPPQYNLLPVDRSLLPGFPAGQHPLFVLGGQDYNITGSAGLLQFALARFTVPFVDRLGDGKTPFSYSLTEFIDNPIAVFLARLTSPSDVYLASIKPPQGSKQAFYVDSGALGFSVHGKNSDSSGLSFVGEPLPLRDLPWPLDSYLTIANQPAFGPHSDKCFHHVEYSPSGVLGVKGAFWIGSPPLQQSTQFSAITGVSAVRYFSEVLGVDCSKFA